MSTHFENWRGDWETAKDAVGDVKRILDIWKKPAPPGWKKEGLNLTQGFRSNSVKYRGEQELERLLLGAQGGFNIHCIKWAKELWPFVAMHHRLYIANQKKGQVIADAFGLILLGSEVHPVAVEVKVKANDCWSAMVQNLLQIRMLRHCHKVLKREFAIDLKGVWGIVLAPKTYFEHDRVKFAACQNAMKALKSTEARVAFCSSDGLGRHNIKYLAGNWR